jgi:hypothetical protein
MLPYLFILTGQRTLVCNEITVCCWGSALFWFWLSEYCCRLRSFALIFEPTTEELRRLHRGHSKICVSIFYCSAFVKSCYIAYVTGGGNSLDSVQLFVPLFLLLLSVSPFHRLETYDI